LAIFLFLWEAASFRAICSPGIPRTAMGEITLSICLKLLPGRCPSLGKTTPLWVPLGTHQRPDLPFAHFLLLVLAGGPALLKNDLQKEDSDVCYHRFRPRIRRQRYETSPAAPAPNGASMLRRDTDLCDRHLFTAALLHSYSGSTSILLGKMPKKTAKTVNFQVQR
jgi:hypothetical protein